MTTNGFAWGVLLFYGGLGLLAFDLAYEDFIRKRRTRTKIWLAVIYIAAIVIASRLWIFRPAPLVAMATFDTPTFGDGSDISGIRWNHSYSRMVVFISNPSSTDYDNFDAQVSTDIHIDKLKEVYGLGNCAIAGLRPDFKTDYQVMRDGQPVGPANSDPNFETDAIPFTQEGKPLISEGYRIRCDKIPANSEIEFVAALNVINLERLHDEHGVPLFLPTRAASWVNIKATFQTLGRRRSQSLYQCTNRVKCATD